MKSSHESRQKSGVRQGLALTLFLWFVSLALGPMAVIGVNEYSQAKSAIVANRYEELSNVNYLLTQRINDYFDTVLTNLFIKAGTSEAFVADLVKAMNAEQSALADYVNSARYQQIQDQYASEYVDFLRFYDYSDVVLGDARGNILYTVNGYEDLGQNLFEGKLAGTRFSRAVQASLAEQQPKYADLGAYPPIGEEQVSFFILPLTNDHQDTTGFIAVQIHPNNIQSIFERDKKLEQDLSSYLVGKDRKIRFGSSISYSSDVSVSEDNPLAKMWLGHLDDEGYYHEKEAPLDEEGHVHEMEGQLDDDHWDSSLHEGINEDEMKQASRVGIRHIRSYINVYGEQVLGIFHPVNISGTPMMMMSEVAHERAFASVIEFRKRLVLLIGFTFILVIIIAVFVSRRLVRPIRTINQWVNRVASGDYVEGMEFSGHNEISELSRSFSQMTEKLRTISNENAQRNWLQDGMAGLNNSVRGEQEMAELCRNVVMYIARYLDMHSGAMYVLDDRKKLQLMGTYAWRQRKQHANRFEIGEGLVGQVALEKQSIELVNVPEDYLEIESGMGGAKPAQIMIIPLIYENELKGVFEFARLHPMTEEQRLFLDHSVENIAIAINSAQYRTRVNQLLEQTTLQSDAMKEQQEELRTVNEELEKRARILEESEEELKAQSEELQKSNTELEEKSEQLMLQKEEIERKNLDIELSSRKVAEKAEELEQASRYKSEFLANMSHELRTPLNSLLLLSQMLAENDEGNLTEDQVESAQVIYNGGKELLGLINDILDLSKVEAGKMSVNLEQTDIEDLGKGIRTLFNPLADSRSLEFTVTIEPGTSRVIFTDSQRLMQIIKNFLSNAFKFTEKGGVYVRVFHESRQGKFAEDTWVGFAIRDSGIGIPREKQASIFESFQQADGSTSRKYGGTGLGLAISREMAELLGGFIEIESEEGKGTIFTLFLPDNPVCSLGPERVLAENCFSEVSKGVQGSSSSETESAPLAHSSVDLSSEAPLDTSQEIEADVEDTEEASLSDRCLLLIEDDSHFTDILGQIAKRHHFKYCIAKTGSEGLEMARKYKPSAIILDLGLPDMDGQQVLEALKQEESTRAVPVHIISGRDPDSVSRHGAVGYLVKPVSMSDLESAFCTLEKAISSDIHHALILDADEEDRSRVGAMLESKGMTVGYVASATDAEIELANTQWQCLVMDLDLGGISGIEFLRKLKENLDSAMPSVVIHTNRALSEEEHRQLQEYTSAMVMKGEKASERVTDEVSLFLHSIDKKIDKNADKSASKASSGPVNDPVEKTLQGHKILLVDDDLRNTFALSRALQAFGLEVIIAENGESGLGKLEEEDGIELVLMDVMMPVMDGYEATRKIREIPDYSDLPVIALTAKAMSGDKAKCIKAGANDYMTKPVDMDKLVAMLRVWLLS